MAKAIQHHRAKAWYERLNVWRAVLTIVLVTAAFSVVAAVVMRVVEPETFTNLGDALWWSVATVSTTGYGDLVPTTGAGRVVAGLTMLVGMAFVPLLTTVVITVLIQRNQETRQREIEQLQNLRDEVERVQAAGGTDAPAGAQGAAGGADPSP